MTKEFIQTEVVNEVKESSVKKWGKALGKTGLIIGLGLLPNVAFAAAADEAKSKINTIGKAILNVLIAVVGVFLTIMLITRAMKIMQGEMTARELVPPIAGGVVAFLAYFIAKMVLENMFRPDDVDFNS